MTTEEIRYVALVPLLMPQGPGVVPSVLRLDRGEIFSLDGDEPIDIDMLLASGAVRHYNPGDIPVSKPITKARVTGRKPALKPKDRR